MNKAYPNETDLGIVLGRGVQTIKNIPDGLRGRHPIDASASGSPPQRPLEVAAGTTAPLHF
jgi:hypothetical protein